MTSRREIIAIDEPKDMLHLRLIVDADEHCVDEVRGRLTIVRIDGKTILQLGPACTCDEGGSAGCPVHDEAV